jgi:two-component system, LytTR family, sensor histidine kinase AlgZ
MHRLNTFLSSEFIFSSRYRIWRHVIYWSFHIAIWAAFWIVMGARVSYERQLFNMALWVPVFILFSYPLVYGAIPHLLLKGKVTLFFLTILAWGAVGLYIDSAFRNHIYIPLQTAMGLDFILPAGRLPSCYLCMTTSAASPMIIKFFKLLTIKQREWMLARQEKITAELQLLKAQVHPNFLFNTLSNIHSFSMDNSPKTPGLILKLSSLLSYMLYDCNTEEVRLEKEIEAMKNYIDLERERLRNAIEISWNVEGNVKDKFIPPLLLLPFLENAFKHGVSEQIEKSWLSVDLSITPDTLRCKIVNSKDELTSYKGNGFGITNVMKRLAYIYAGKHELKLNDEGNFFVISLMVKLANSTPEYIEPRTHLAMSSPKPLEAPVPAYS